MWCGPTSIPCRSTAASRGGSGQTAISTGWRSASTWEFYDYRVLGQPPNLVQMRGPVTMGGPEGFVFHNVTLDSADLDLPTIRLAVPAVILEGRARGSGTLEGPWKDVTFTGHLVQNDEDRPVSTMEGRIRINTRDTIVALDADLNFLPLDFEGVRRSFPTLTSTGDLRGPVHLEGPLDRMLVRADVEGVLGRVKAEGFVTMLPPRWGADGLRLEFTDLDLSAARGKGPVTRLSGTALVSGSVDSLVAPEGDLDLVLAPGWIREITFDTLRARLRVKDSVITVDTSLVGFTGASVTASGTLGWAKPKDGTLTITAHADQLTAFDSLLTAAVQSGARFDRHARAPQRDRGCALHPQGRARLYGRAGGGHGSRGALERVSPARRARELAWRGGTRAGIELTATADSLTRGRFDVHGIEFAARGLVDSLRWRLSAASGGSVAIATSGEYLATSGRTLVIDTLDLELRGNDWSSEAPFRGDARGQHLVLLRNGGEPEGRLGPDRDGPGTCPPSAKGNSTSGSPASTCATSTRSCCATPRG